MRIRATAVVVTAVAVLALAATIDALRRDGEGEAPRRVRSAAPTATQSASRDLEREGVSGLLYLTVRTAAVCEFRVYALPRLTITSGGGLATCRFQVSPDGRHIAELHECPAREGLLRELFDPSIARAFPGCAAAWKPDGTLTYVSRGAVVEAESLDCLGAVGCARAILSRRAVARGAARLGTRFRSALLTQTEWLTGMRMAAVVRDGSNAESIVFFQGRKPDGVLGFPFALHTHVEAVPRRREILVGGRGQGMFAFPYEGRSGSPNQVPFGDAAAVAESPDGRWLALARPGNACIYRRRDESVVGCIPADAQDLTWR
jgi:hypothetical protein